MDMNFCNNLKRSGAICGLVCLTLANCGNGKFDDLDRFMAEKRARPGGAMTPIPAFQAQQSFRYGASALRTPFGRPNAIRRYARWQSAKAVPPDFERPRELLEQHTIASLFMVGSLSQGGDDWSLIEDPQGNIHRVKVGSYLGHNHGRVVETGKDYVVVVEVLADGNGGWTNRPRIIELRDS